MNSKITYLIIGLALFLQLVFSFYFSNEIINENQKYQLNTQKLQEITSEIEELENLYTGLTSINALYPTATASGYQPINKTLDLTKDSPQP